MSVVNSVIINYLSYLSLYISIEIAILHWFFEQDFSYDRPCHISSRLIVIYLTRSSTNAQVNRTIMRSVHNNTEISLCSIAERASRR